MQKWISTFFIGVALLSNTPMNAAWDCWDCHSNLRFDVGYRQDNYEWKLRIPNEIEFENSEDDLLRSNFNDVHVLQLGLHLDGTFCNCVYGRAEGQIGWILDGNHDEKFRFVQSSTGGIDTVDVVEIHNVIDGRNTVDFSFALGYPFRCWNSCWVIAPVAGYSYKSQYVFIDRNQRFAPEPASVTPAPVTHQPVLTIQSCHQDKWLNKWYGPFIGFDTLYDSCDCFRLYGQFEFHFARFKGKKQVAHDFSIPSTFFPSDFLRNFDVSARKNTHGYLFRIGGEYDITQCVYAGIEALYQRFTANKKIDLTESDLTLFEKSRLTAKLHSWGIRFMIGSHY